MSEACWCRIINDGDGKQHIKYCLLHRHAPQLLEAAKALLTDWNERIHDEEDRPLYNKVMKAITQAEGRPDGV